MTREWIYVLHVAINAIPVSHQQQTVKIVQLVQIEVQHRTVTVMPSFMMMAVLYVLPVIIHVLHAMIQILV